MSKEDQEVWGWLLIGFFAGFIMAALISLLWTEPLSRTEGYCAALLGERISNNVCIVDGMVLVIP
jgi:hypothetical protein